MGVLQTPEDALSEEKADWLRLSGPGGPRSPPPPTPPVSALGFLSASHVTDKELKEQYLTYAPSQMGA